MADVKKILGYDIKDNSARNDITSLANRVSNLEQATYSHVGMIIHSTTLNTEDKVKAIYGGTKWIQHSGYFLRGARSGVVANSATKSGGEDTHTLTESEMPKHKHTITIN